MLVSFVFLLAIIFHRSSCQYDRNNAAAGIKLSANDQLLVSASNAFFNFGVVINPFNSSRTDVRKHCNVKYLSTDHFVHSVRVIGAANNGTNRELFMFAFAGEITTVSTLFICLVTVSRSTCEAQRQMTILQSADKPQNYFLIGVDSHATFIYGFTDTIAFKLEIATNQIVQNLTLEALWPSIIFIPHALDLGVEWAVVVGYGFNRSEKKNYAIMECFIDLISFISRSCQTLIIESTYLVPSNLLSYNEFYEVSVAIRNENVLVGIHRLNTIVILQKNETSLIKTHVYTVTSSSLSSFGRLVGWVDEQTIAVVAYHSFHTSWSQSQIFFYDKNLVSSTSPLYTFPNNQQVIGSKLLQPHFVRLIITNNGNLALLTDFSHVIVLPMAPINYASVWIEPSARTFVFYYSPMTCIGGTFKNESGLGPCTVCLPGTRNPGIACFAGTSCIPCSRNSSNSYCSLASLVEFDLNTMPSYSQITAYPVSADTTNFDDILLENMFHIDLSSSCLIISPFFWTLVAGAFAFSVWIIMTVIKLGKWKQYNRYRTQVKTIFTRTDLISEGQLWVGGLATMAIIVLVSFAYWFSISFLKRYPIEEIFEPANFACDSTLINAKFTTGLDLLAIPKSIDAQRIITLLDNQIFNITVELINTGFTCDNITVQENLIGTHYADLIIPSCERSEWNAVTSVTFTLPYHYSSVQLNMTGPHWASAVRICLRGESQTMMNSMLHALDFCQLFSAENQTLAHASTIPFILMKIINITKSMEKSHSTTYSGLWLSSVHGALLSNEAFYAEFGNYLRYTFALTTIRITFEERSFYIKNIQEPIVRTRQTVFQALLFTSLVIELFGFSFLLTKLFVLPIMRRMVTMCQKYRNRIQNHQNDVPVQHTRSSQHASRSSVYVNLELERWPKVECTPSNQFQSNQIDDIEIDCISLEARRHMYLPNRPCKYVLTRRASEPRLVCLEDPKNELDDCHGNIIPSRCSFVEENV
ncbi:unnamed protein product [Adineta steineri]|uniref:Uncharacterized protein n=1 Tax=Adineta steineri TaxID=433720 RepID=A0A814I5V0_9BILA|nr:unnamed protein product [Adineta steineri]CAF1019378.1 unnamed protein product [Adineta steineri]CAF1124396.1 unnamed protein product [Adineta steineri]